MPRLIHAALPRYEFHTDVQVYISHVNQGGHLDNAQLLSLVSEARVRFFQALGYREGHIEGTAVVVGDMLAPIAVLFRNFRRIYYWNDSAKSNGERWNHCRRRQSVEIYPCR